MALLHSVGETTEQIDNEHRLEKAEGSDFGLKVILGVILAAFVWQFVRSAIPLMTDGGFFAPVLGVALLVIPVVMLAGVLTNVLRSRKEDEQRPLATVRDITAAVPQQRTDPDAQDLAA